MDNHRARTTPGTNTGSFASADSGRDDAGQVGVGEDTDARAIERTISRLSKLADRDMGAVRVASAHRVERDDARPGEQVIITYDGVRHEDFVVIGLNGDIEGWDAGSPQGAQVRTEVASEDFEHNHLNDIHMSEYDFASRFATPMGMARISSNPVGSTQALVDHRWQEAIEGRLHSRDHGEIAEGLWTAACEEREAVFWQRCEADPTNPEVWEDLERVQQGNRPKMSEALRRLRDAKEAGDEQAWEYARMELSVISDILELE